MASSKQQRNRQPGAAMHRARAYLHAAWHSVALQSSLQVGVGMAISTVFTYVTPISFPPMSCVTATWFCVCAVMASPANHVGVRVNAAAAVLGSTWVGVTLAAAAVSVAKAAAPLGSPVYSAVIALLCAAGLVPLSINRVSPSPPTLWAEGMNAALSVSLMGLSGYSLPSIARVWYIAGTLILSNLIAAIVAVLVAALVMPTHASTEVQQAVADTLLLAGKATARNGARLFRPRPSSSSSKALKADGSVSSSNSSSRAMPSSADADLTITAVAAAAADAAVVLGKVAAEEAQQTISGKLDTFDDDSYHLGEAGAALVMTEGHTEAEWLQIIQRNSAPKPAPWASAYACPMPQLPMASLRPRLAKAQTLFMAAAAVEPQWLRGGLATLAGRPGSFWFDTAAWNEVAAGLQVLLTRLSALEAVIEDGESLHGTSVPGFSSDLLCRLQHVYSTAATSLALMSHTVKAYGGHAAPGSATAPGSRSTASAAVASQHSWAATQEQLAEAMRRECELHWTDVLAAAPDSPAVLPSLTATRHVMFTWSLTTALIDTLEGLEGAVAAAVCSSTPAPGLLTRLAGWLAPPSVSGAVSGLHQARNVAKVLGSDLPRELRHGWLGVRSLAANPLVQAGFKYWLAVTLVFVGILLGLHFQPALRAANPTFGVVAAALCMSERVEATFSKFTFHLVGSALGGAVGWAAMWHPALGTNPYGLVAVVTGFALVVGAGGVTKARITVTLALMTLSTLILCQCCGHAGSPVIAAARVVSVLAGITTSVAVCNLVLPWYTSTWAVATLASTFASICQLSSQMHAQMYAAGAAAVAAFDAACPASPPSAGDTAAGSDDANAGAESGSGSTIVADAAAAAFDVAAAAGAASQLAGRAVRGAAGLTCPLTVTPACLQSLVAAPLVSVQTALIMDTVAWQRGVLATPPIVPALLQVMFGLLDRIASLQLALHPPRIKGFTGVAFAAYGVPMAANVCRLLELTGELAVATAAVLQHPGSERSHAVHKLVSTIAAHRVQMYMDMQQLRQQLHIQVLSEQRQQQLAGQQPGDSGGAYAGRRRMAALLGGVDDVVQYMGFQFCNIKLCDRLSAVARVAAADACRGRNGAGCTLK